MMTLHGPIQNQFESHINFAHLCFRFIANILERKSSQMNITQSLRRHMRVLWNTFRVQRTQIRAPPPKIE